LAASKSSWGDKLLKSVDKKVKEVVGFGKVLLAVVKELAQERKNTRDSLSQQLERNREQVNTEANKIRPLVNTNNDSTNDSLQVSHTVIVSRADFLKKYPFYKIYLELKDTYDAMLRKHNKDLVIFLVLNDLATNQERLTTLAQQLEDKANAAFKTYQQMKGEQQSDEAIQQAIKPLVAQFLQGDLLDPTLQKYDLKD